MNPNFEKKTFFLFGGGEGGGERGTGRGEGRGGGARVSKYFLETIHI